MRQSLEWQLKKGPQAVVLETSAEFSLDFTGHSIQHSPTPDIFIPQPAAVPVQKRQPVPQRCAAWKKNLAQIKGWTKAPPEPAWSLSVVPVEWESIATAQTDHTSVCCRAGENVVEHNSDLTQHCTYLSTGIFCSVHGTWGLSLQPLFAFVPRRDKSCRGWTSFSGELPFCLGSASSSWDNREPLLLCFLLVLATTSAS